MRRNYVLNRLINDTLERVKVSDVQVGDYIVTTEEKPVIVIGGTRNHDTKEATFKYYDPNNIDKVKEFKVELTGNINRVRLCDKNPFRIISSKKMLMLVNNKEKGNYFRLANIIDFDNVSNILKACPARDKKDIKTFRISDESFTRAMIRSGISSNDFQKVFHPAPAKKPNWLSFIKVD